MARHAVATLCLLSALPLSAATRIDNPKTFVAEVYRRFITDSHYNPPEDIYTPRLQRLISEDKRMARGEIGCLDFVFWLNAQDWEITSLAVTSSDTGPNRQIVISRFRNFGRHEEVSFDFRRTSGVWLLDDARSRSNRPWTLSKLLKCAH